MPDPAIEAYKAGLRYVEPQGNAYGPPKGLKRVKVRFERDPNNPSAAPRRIFEKMGFWERMFGSSDDNYIHPTPQPYLPFPPVLTAVPAPAPASTAPRPLPPTTTPVQAALAVTDQSHFPAILRPTPFPLNFRDLSRSERHAWERQRKEEIKYLKAVEKERKAARKAEEAAKGREAKLAMQKQKDEMKWAASTTIFSPGRPDVDDARADYLRAYKAAVKLEKKLGYRPMPEYIPPSYRPLPPTTIPAAAPPPNLGPPTGWMLLPTLEEFGVRRPFDAPGQPSKIDIGGTEWPMMSRTMTHEMSREERVHLDQAGHTWAPGWYRD